MLSTCQQRRQPSLPHDGGVPGTLRSWGPGWCSVLLVDRKRVPMRFPSPASGPSVCAFMEKKWKLKLMRCRQDSWWGEMKLRYESSAHSRPGILFYSGSETVFERLEKALEMACSFHALLLETWSNWGWAGDRGRESVFLHSLDLLLQEWNPGFLWLWLNLTLNPNYRNYFSLYRYTPQKWAFPPGNPPT